MLTCPKIGQVVELHYNRRLAASGATSHHGRLVVVVARKTKGRPRSSWSGLPAGRTAAGGLPGPMPLLQVLLLFREKLKEPLQATPDARKLLGTFKPSD